MALDFFPEAKPAKVVMRNGMTELPTLPGDLEELQRVLQRIARRLDKVPFDSIGEELNQSLKSLHQTLDGMRKLSENMDGKVLPQAVKTLEDLQKTLESTRQTMRADSPLQQDVRAAAQEVSETARSFRALADYLDRHPEALIRGKGDKK